MLINRTAQRIIIIGLVSAVVATTIDMFGVKVFDLWFHPSCPISSTLNAHVCVPDTPIRAQVELMLIASGMWLTIIMGIIIGRGYTKRMVSARRVVGEYSLTFLVYLAALILGEVIRYRPWETITTPAGSKYTEYGLNVVYGTSLSLFPFVVGLLGVGIAISFSPRLWARFEPFGRKPKTV